MEEIKEGYTRVSEIVGWFKANELAKIDPDTLRKKCQLGTNVHAAIAGYEEGIYVPLDEKEQGYFQSYKIWRKETDLLVVHEEKRLYDDEWSLTGAVDCICSDPSGGLFLIDFKTSIKEDKVGWPLQGAFYHRLCKMNGISLQRTFMFVQLHKEGKMASVYQYEITPSLMKNTKTCYEAYKIWH